MKQIRNLTDELYAFVESCGQSKDDRFQSWCKTVVAVDETKQNGYAFVGAFLRDGTVEVEIAPQLFLVMTTNGSRRYQTSTYRLVKMDANGDLVDTGVTTTGATPGWALRIRNLVRDELDAIAASNAQSSE